MPSAMHFTRPDKSATDLVSNCGKNRVRVCYSTHSSYEEVVDFLRALKPVRIFANVCTKDHLDLDEVNRSIKFLEATNGVLPNKRVANQRLTNNIAEQGPKKTISFKKRRPNLFDTTQ
jgi:hypothetical protein